MPIDLHVQFAILMIVVAIALGVLTFLLSKGADAIGRWNDEQERKKGEERVKPERPESEVFD